MHPALIKLAALHARARFRWMFRGKRSARGFLFIGVGALLILAWIVPVVAQHAQHGRDDPAIIRRYLPIALLTFCIANLISAVGERAISFSPAETDFLFPGPFTRRELLLYKILRGAFTALISAAVFSIWLWNFSTTWIAAYLAAFLALMFLQLLGISLMLAALSVNERILGRVKRAIAVAVIVVLAFAVAPIVTAGRSRGNVQLTESLHRSPIIHAALLPFDVFGRIVAADRLFPDSARWMGVAVLMCGALLFVVLMLDAQYLESAAAAGRRRYEMMQQRRTRGVAGRVATSRARIPFLPRWGGVGPIAWRQLTTALRTSRGVLALLGMIGLGTGIFFYSHRDRNEPIGPAVSAMAWATIILSNALRFDFRGDVDLIDTLKALPLSGTTLCAGQIIAPAVVMSLFHFCLIGVAIITIPDRAIDLLSLAALVLPVNLLLFAVENLVFLIFPTRFASAGPGDLQGSGRTVLVMFLKVLIVVALVSVAGGIAAIIHLLTPLRAVAVGTIVFVLIVELLALIAFMAVALRRFDPSVHTPT